jgi:hypothetical protein
MLAYTEQPEMKVGSNTVICLLKEIQNYNTLSCRPPQAQLLLELGFLCHLQEDLEVAVLLLPQEILLL